MKLRPAARNDFLNKASINAQDNENQRQILEAGRNCWRICKAEKVAFLVDGAAYFEALHDTLPLVEQQLLILSWDLYSRLHLVPVPSEDGDRADSELGVILNDLVGRKSNLHINILGWDFSILYASDREWLPVYKLDWKTHPRLRFFLDDQCPLGASHHQKVVVLDDTLAFAGGLDLTRGRWDTPEHRADDPRRKAIDGGELPVRPHHDVQMAVSGPAAAALGDLARERWWRATGKKLPASGRSGRALWPEKLAADLENVDVAIVRTQPQFARFAEVREVEQLYLDSIGAATDYIYIENQFFTAPSISKALADRLAEADGPEVVMVFPLRTSGWLSQQSMDMMRVIAIRRLRDADKCGRLAVCFPDKPGLGDLSINVHAKVMIIDDRFVRVGSSNLNNRSMGLDTECDLAVEIGGADIESRKAVRAFRNRLLGEHLGCAAERVDEMVVECDSLLKAIEALRDTERSLQSLEPRLPEPDEGFLRDIRLSDPERPVNAQTFLRHFVPEPQAEPASHRILIWTLGVMTLVALAAAWRFTPLSGLLDITTLNDVAIRLRGSFLTPLAVVGAFVIGGFLMVPVTAMIVVSVLIFDPLAGYAYALAGSLLSAVAGYGVGAALGREVVRQLAGERIRHVSRQLARRGLLTVLVVRVVPVAPFTVINLVAGVSHIRFRDFVIGTLLGMAPGMFGITLVTDRTLAAIRSPDTETILTLVLVVAVLLAVGYLLSRRLLKLTSNSVNEAEQKTPSPRRSDRR